MQLVIPPLLEWDLVTHRETTNPNRERLGRIYKVWETKAIENTVSSTSIAAVYSEKVPEKNSI